jgi:hypothetical protein
VVTHEVDGLLVPVKDASALAQAIERLHQDPALARQLGLAARARALREFDERIVIGQTLAVYGELLGKQGRSAPEWVEMGGEIDAQPLPVGRSQLSNVRPAWAHSCGCKSRREWVMTIRK